MLDIKQLKYFTAIAEHGNITKAAEQLYMSQPPLSRQLKAMEEKLGVLLFDRSNKKNMILTPQGQVLLKHATEILHRMEDAMTEVQEYGQYMTPKLSIGTTIYCSEILLPKLKQFQDKYPHIVPEIHEGNPSSLMHLLKDRVVDLVISAKPSNTEHYQTKELAPDICVLAVPEHFSWDKPSISLEEITSLPLLLLNAPDSDSLYGRILIEFEKNNLQPNIASLSHDSGLLLKMVQNNFGVTIVPRSLVKEDHFNTLRAIPIDNDPWQTKPNLIWDSQAYVSSTVQLFINSFEAANN